MLVEMLRGLAILGLLGVAFLSCAAEEASVAAIVDSGSTNRAGFRITIDHEGAAVLTSAPRRFAARGMPPDPIRRVVPKALRETFYADLRAAGPLASLPAMDCAKSVSFGSTLSVEFGGEQTPDLSCGDGGNAALRDLIRDVRQISDLMHSE